jgi:hypothetical protein
MYPGGKNYVLSPKIHQPYTKNLAGMEVEFVSIEGFVSKQVLSGS